MTTAKKPLKTIDDYISGFPEDVRKVLQQLRLAIREQVPSAEEAMKYGIPTFRLNDQNLVHFAGYEKHIGFYPTPSGIAAFKDELKPYKSAKGSVQFPLDKPLPIKLVLRIVAFRVKETES